MTHLTHSRIAPLLLCVGLSIPASAAVFHADARGFSSHAGVSTTQPENLDALMAPIALYPDALALQILDCSSSPDQIKKLNDWTKKNSDVKGTAAQDAATAAGFEPHFVAIVMFPQVVQMMVDKPGWTRDVARAFTDDRSGLLASIQRLRRQAHSLGNLTTTEQQKVETVTTGSSQQVIVIQPANPEIVYVPTYTSVAYTQPPPPPSSGQVVGAGVIGFTAGVIIGAAIADDDCGWAYNGGLCDEGYEHREEMAQQRGQNQSNRQDSRTEKRSGRQDSRSENQAGRQENQTGRQERRGSGSGSNQSGGGQQAGLGNANEARGSTPSSKSTAGQRVGTRSGAMSGYQSGSKEREASSRGRNSTSSKSSGGGRGGGCGRGGGGGRGR